MQRNIIFSRPLGTGLKMIYQGETIEISKISTIPNYKISKGLIGAVVLKNANGSVWIKTKDTAISIDELIGRIGSGDAIGAGRVVNFDNDGTVNISNLIVNTSYNYATIFG